MVCRHGVQLAPHGKTHMSPQLAARQLAAGACAVTVATISQARTYRAFGVSALILANELVDVAGLRWLASELDDDPNFDMLCWVDSVRGVELMTDALAAAGLRRAAGRVRRGRRGRRAHRLPVRGRRRRGRPGRRGSPHLRLAGVSGYEAALGHDVSPAGRDAIRAFLSTMRSAVLRLADVFETDDVVVTAGGSTHFDLVAEMLTGMARRPRGSHRAAQRVLPDPRRRAVPAHVAAGLPSPR